MKTTRAFLAFTLAAFLLAVSNLHAPAELTASAGATAPSAASAQFTSDGNLVRPAGYRRWAYVSTGFGMSYNPSAGGNGNPAFTNVFVSAEAMDYFEAHGTWPDKTMFVLEIYG